MFAKTVSENVKFLCDILCLLAAKKQQFQKLSEVDGF